jgi:hypothetical protein
MLGGSYPLEFNIFYQPYNREKYLFSEPQEPNHPRKYKSSKYSKEPTTQNISRIVNSTCYTRCCCHETNDKSNANHNRITSKCDDSNKKCSSKESMSRRKRII